MLASLISTMLGVSVPDASPMYEHQRSYITGVTMALCEETCRHQDEAGPEKLHRDDSVTRIGMCKPHTVISENECQSCEVGNVIYQEGIRKSKVHDGCGICLV
jgi:hypothetical protein